MQSPHLDTNAYQDHVFESGPGFETGTKLHHAGYIGDLESSYFNNYTHSGTHTVQGYGSLDPHACTEAHMPFSPTVAMSNLSNVDLQMEVADYTNPLARVRQQGNCRASLDSYNTNDHSSHDYDLQQQYHYHIKLPHYSQYQRSYYLPQRNTLAAKFPENNTATLCQSSDKIECSKLESYHNIRRVDKLPLPATTAPASTTFSNIQKSDTSTRQHTTSPSSDLVSSRIPPHLLERKSDDICSKISMETPLTQTVTTDTRDEATINESKPTMSYISLIGKAILESEQKRLNLGSIYSWIENHYPFYKRKGQGWRNSVRHNLSLNDCFIKAGRCEDGKGNYWAIHPENIQDFMRGDFRQRRRSRRRGRKKECDLNMYNLSNGYLQSSNMHMTRGISISPSELHRIYGPYTERERRVYRLDEALLRHSINNPFVKWYQQGLTAPGYGSTSPPVCTAGVYPGSNHAQWSQGCTDSSSHGTYLGHSSTLPR